MATSTSSRAPRYTRLNRLCHPPEPVPLEDPHQRRDFQPADPHLVLGERPDVKALADCVTRRGQQARDGAPRPRNPPESLGGPASDQLVHIGLAIQRKARGDVHVDIRPEPESVHGVERSRPRAKRPTQLRPHVRADDARIGRGENAQGVRVFFPEEIWKRAEALEFRPRLQFDDPAMASAEERRVERQIAEKITSRELGRDDEGRRVDVAEGRFVDARVGVQAADLPTPTVQLRSTSVLPLASNSGSRPPSIALRLPASRTAISLRYSQPAVLSRAPASPILMTRPSIDGTASNNSWRPAR